MGLPVHLRGRGGPPAGLPCGSQIPTYLSLGVRSLRDLDHHVTACSEGVRACGGGGGCWACFRSGPISVGGGGGSKRSAPLFPGPHEEPAHGLHPRFVVAEIWADRGDNGGGGGAGQPQGPISLEHGWVQLYEALIHSPHQGTSHGFTYGAHACTRARGLVTASTHDPKTLFDSGTLPRPLMLQAGNLRGFTLVSAPGHQVV